MRRSVATILVFLAVGACAGSSLPGRIDPTPRARPSFERPPAFAGEPCGLEVTPADVWILSCSGTLVRVPKDGGAGTAVHLGGEVLALDGLTATSSVVWGLVARSTRGGRVGEVVPVDPATGAPAAAVGVGSGVPMGAASVGDALWVGMIDGRLLSVAGGAVQRIDTGDPLIWVTAGPAEVWTVTEAGEVARRDPADGSITARFEDAVPEAIAVATAFGSFWAATPTRILRFRGGEAPVRIDADATVNGIEPCGGRLWLSLPDAGLRPLTAAGTHSGTIALDVSPRYLACDGDMLWVLAEDGRLGAIPATG